MLARGEIKEKGVLYQDKSIPWDLFQTELELRDITISARTQQL
jgi:hypothetical protein